AAGAPAAAAGPSPPVSAPAREGRGEACLVPPPPRQGRAAVAVVQVPPLAREDGRDVELLRDDPQVTAEREPDALDGRRVLRNGVERRVERLRARAHRLEEELLLRPRVRVERSLLHPELLGQVTPRGAVEPSLGEEPGRRAGQVVPPRRHILDANDRSVGRSSRGYSKSGIP